MPDDRAISDHYQHGDLLNAIKNALEQLGKTTDTITIDDLALVDEFHIGGRVATENILGQIRISKHDHVLDVGCGLGGAARFVAKKFNSKVTGIDLTQEYIDTGNELCSWLGLDKQITLQQGSALSMPFEEGTFDCGYMMHVGMNIENKAQLFKEIFRVLRPGSSFAIYDVMRIINGELVYPVPWAADKSLSSLASLAEYKNALGVAGFNISSEYNRSKFATQFFEQLQKNNAVNSGPPALGLHTLMKDTTAKKISNMINNIAANYIAPVELIVKKY